MIPIFRLFLPLACGLTWSQPDVSYRYANRLDVEVSVYKNFVQSFLPSDTPDDEKTPFNNEGVSRLDLRDLVDEKSHSFGFSVTAMYRDVVGLRPSLDFSKYFYSEDLTGGGEDQVSRMEYNLDLLLGLNIRRLTRPGMEKGPKILVYCFLGPGWTDYEETIHTSSGETLKGNQILEDVFHFNWGAGTEFKLVKFLNLGVELGAKVRGFKTTGTQQPDGTGSEGYLKGRFGVNLAFL